MDDNKRNLVYFEAPSMRELYSQMDAWQADKRKRLQSVSVHRDGDLFCCIGMTNPNEVILVSSRSGLPLGITSDSSMALNVSVVNTVKTT